MVNKRKHRDQKVIILYRFLLSKFHTQFSWFFTFIKYFSEVFNIINLKNKNTFIFSINFAYNSDYVRILPRLIFCKHQEKVNFIVYELFNSNPYGLIAFSSNTRQAIPTMTGLLCIVKLPGLTRHWNTT